MQRSKKWSSRCSFGTLCVCVCVRNSPIFGISVGTQSWICQWRKHLQWDNRSHWGCNNRVQRDEKSQLNVQSRDGTRVLINHDVTKQDGLFLGSPLPLCSSGHPSCQHIENESSGGPISSSAALKHAQAPADQTPSPPNPHTEDSTLRNGDPAPLLSYFCDYVHVR